MNELRFDGQVAIVTGAGRGIGRGYALALGARGARVVVADLGGSLDGGGSSTDPADQVAAEIKASGGEAVACYASVAEEAGAESIIATAIETFGRVDAVVNNAGISARGRFETLSVEHFRRMLDVHFFGTLFVIRAAWPHFVDAGYGRIVNTVSEAIFGGIVEQTHYAAAKGAVLGLTRSLATEGGPLGIKVNAIAPRGFTRLSAAGAFKTSSAEYIERMQKLLAPELNSPAVVLLAHESCPLNGEVLRGGMGSVARLAFVHTNGLAKESLTPEDVAENLDTVLDVRDGIITDCRELTGGL